MQNERGLTLIKLMIVFAILGIVAAIAIPALSGKKYPPEQASTKCIAGYTFTLRDVQILDGQGKGIPCNNGPSPSQSKPM